MANFNITLLDDWEHNYGSHTPSSADWQAVHASAKVTIHHEPLTGQALVAACKDAQALVLTRDRTPLTKVLIDQLPHLKYVVFTGTRNTQLDFAACAARGIAVSCTPFGPSKENTCEITWALILGALKQLEPSAALMRKGLWRDPSGTQLMPLLHGQRIGMIGLGEIGSRVATVAKAFGMEVVTWSPNMTAERAAAKGALAVSLEELLTTSKVVSLHLVPSAATKGLMNAERLGMMRTDAVLVNTSRAALIDMPALLNHLQSGKGFAGLDVYDLEPFPADHPLRSLPNVLLTPHLGFVCEPVFKNFDTGVAECLAAWVQNKPLVRVTDGK